MDLAASSASLRLPRHRGMLRVGAVQLANAMPRLCQVLLVSCAAAWLWPGPAAADWEPFFDLKDTPSQAVAARSDPSLSGSVRRRMRDDEQPPAAETNSERQLWLVRLSLGIQANLMRMSGANRLRKPTFANLDLGYSPVPRLTLLLRVGSWLPYEPFALQFVGAGASYMFASEGIFVTGIVGMSVLDDQFGLPGDSGEAVQGVTAQVELGQQWNLSRLFTFTIGAHAELGTPWLRSDLTATDVGVGMFAAIGYH